MERFRLILFIVCVIMFSYWAVTLTQAVGNLYSVVKAHDNQISDLQKQKEDHHVGNKRQGEIQR
jgi:archaellum component FlaG (FlaF/FlaG flagellin family)